MIPTSLSVADLAKRMNAVSGAGEPYHARQIRAQIKEGALQGYGRGGSGLTAPTLFDETGLCRAMVLYTLAMIGLEMPLLRQASDAMSVVAPGTRKGDTTEPSDGMSLAISRIRAGEEVYFHLAFGNWPGDEGDLGVSGWISDRSEPTDLKPMPRIAFVVLPLHTILKPLLGAA
jgi:hypothetical protein